MYFFTEITPSSLTIDVSDTLTWLKGSHRFSLGASFTHVGLWAYNQTVVPQIGFGIATGDPADPMFNTTNFEAFVFPISASARPRKARSAECVGSSSRLIFSACSAISARDLLALSARNPLRELSRQAVERAENEQVVLRIDRAQIEDDSIAFDAGDEGNRLTTEEALEIVGRLGGVLDRDEFGGDHGSRCTAAADRGFAVDDCRLNPAC